MFGIRYKKASPTDYVVHSSNGRIVREGAGLAFFYFAPSSSIASIPLASSNLPFAFQEPTSDFQTLTVQGQLSYRILDPKKAAALLDFTLDARDRYLTDHYQKLPERLVYSLQTLVRAQIQAVPLRTALRLGDKLASIVLEQLAAAPSVAQLGIEVLNLSILALKPTPEMAKALEAEAREALNRESDSAIYLRRNAAIEQERRIKENELQTDLLVQEKQRELREKGIEAEIAIETQRTSLLAEKLKNERNEADGRAYALNAVLEPARTTDWRILTMLLPGGSNPSNTIAMAFQELAANANKIGELNMSPDLLQALLGKGK